MRNVLKACSVGATRWDHSRHRRSSSAAQRDAPLAPVSTVLFRVCESSVVHPCAHAAPFLALFAEFERSTDKKPGADSREEKRGAEEDAAHTRGGRRGERRDAVDGRSILPERAVCVWESRGPQWNGAALQLLRHTRIHGQHPHTSTTVGVDLDCGSASAYRWCAGLRSGLRRIGFPGVQRVGLPLETFRQLADVTPHQAGNWVHRRAAVDSAPDHSFRYNTRLESVFTDSHGCVVVVCAVRRRLLKKNQSQACPSAFVERRPRRMQLVCWRCCSVSSISHLVNEAYTADTLQGD